MRRFFTVLISLLCVSVCQDGFTQNPQVTLRTSVTSPAYPEPIPVVALIDRPVSALEASQIAVSNATVTNFRQFTPSNGTAGSRPTVALGWYHGVAIRPDGSLVAWGDDFYAPPDVPAGNDFVAVAANNEHFLALRADGSLASWGWDMVGQAPVPSGNDFTAIAAGSTFNLALRADGTLTAWGYDSLSEYNEGNVPTGSYIAIAAGGTYGLGLSVNGSIVAWGTNPLGPLTPTLNSDFINISASAFHSLAQRADGSLDAWGWKSTGMDDLPMDTDFMAIEAGGDHGLALRADGTLAYWGNSMYTPDGLTPITEKFMALAAGCYNSAAIRPDGTLAVWGDSGPCALPAGLTVKLPMSNTVMFDLVPAAPGAVSVQIPAGVCFDGAGNPNDASNLLTITNDTDGPAALITTTAPSPTNANPIPVTIAFNEPVVGFAIENVAVTGGGAVIVGNEGDTVFTLQVTPATDGTVGVSVPAGVCTDGAGNPNTASNEVYVEYDGTGPAATVATTAASPTNTSPIPFTITFTEPVSGFGIEDVSVTNGAAALAGNVDNLIFTVQVTPAGPGAVSVAVGAGVCGDALGNPNTASNAAEVTYEQAPAGPTSSLSILGKKSEIETVLNLGVTATGGQGALTTALFVKLPGATSYIDTDLRVAGASGVFSYDLTGRPAGRYEFLSQATDAAGNTQILGGRRDSVAYNYKPPKPKK